MYQFTVQTILFDSTFLLPCWVNKPIALSIDLENIFISYKQQTHKHILEYSIKEV